MAFRIGNSADHTAVSWHNWSRLDMELCWWIPQTMSSSFGCLGQGISRTHHDCTTLIWLMPDVWNSKGVAMGHSTCRAIENSRDQHVYSELLEETDINVLHTLGVHPIHNQFWQFPLCNVHQLWQPDELHQLLLGWVKDLLHWQLKSPKATNVKDQFDNWFTLVPQYPGLQRFPKPFNSTKCSSWQGKEIRGMIRSPAVNCVPIVYCPKDDRKTLAETASDEMVMGPVQALCEFALLVTQQNDSDLSLTALDDALKRL